MGCRDEKNMMLLHFVKNLPTPIRTLIRPMWCVSLGLHGLLLTLPIPSTPEIEPSAEKKKSVKITQLPPQPSPLVQLSKPSFRVQQSPLPPNPSPVKALPPDRFILRQSTLRSPIIEAPKRPQIAQQNTPSPTPTPTPVASPTPTPTPTPTNPLANFPELAGITPGCGGQPGCWKVEGTNMRSVASNQIEPFLAAQGYTLLRNEEIGDDHHNVYRVSNRTGGIEYLHLLSTDDGLPVLVFADSKDLTREQLIALAKG